MRYRVVEPCAYAVDGAAVYHTRAGAVVELDAAVARGLGGRVECLDPPKKPRRKDAEGGE